MSWIPDETFATRLMIVRHEKKLSTRELAKLLGVTDKTVWNWEHGKVPKNIAETAEQIAAITGVDRDWLLWGRDDSVVAQEYFFGRDAGIQTTDLCEESNIFGHLVYGAA